MLLSETERLGVKERLGVERSLLTLLRGPKDDDPRDTSLPMWLRVLLSRTPLFMRELPKLPLRFWMRSRALPMRPLSILRPLRFWMRSRADPMRPLSIPRPLRFWMRSRAPPKRPLSIPRPLRLSRRPRVPWFL